MYPSQNLPRGLDSMSLNPVAEIRVADLWNDDQAGVLQENTMRPGGGFKFSDRDGFHSRSLLWSAPTRTVAKGNPHGREPMGNPIRAHGDGPEWRVVFQTVKGLPQPGYERELTAGDERVSMSMGWFPA